MMANRQKRNQASGSASKNSRRHVGEAMFPSSSSSDESEVTAGCRNRRNALKEHFSKSRNETDQPAAENPFSFKHFLKDGAQANYHNTGARPKVYTSVTCPNSIECETRVYSRNPTELPDFVQDHLVMEQCYLNHESSHPVDVDNLPDFALNSMKQKQTRHRSESKKCESDVSCDLPFDLTGCLDEEITCTDRPLVKASRPAYLDLPALDRNYAEPNEHSDASGFPLDLPLPQTESDPSSDATTRECPVVDETNVAKSLPDFLSDGPIHNRTADAGSSSNMTESTERKLLLENEILRHELEVAKNQLYEKSKRIVGLKVQLAGKREKEYEETVNLEKAMEQVEDNLKRSTRRAVSAESTVTSLKKEIKTLTTEILMLRRENKQLRVEMAAASGNDCGSSSNVDRTIRRLASDLRTAASNAEVSLRQLMSGVDNLRVLASTLENVDRIEDRTKDFLPDFDEDNAAGPAL